MTLFGITFTESTVLALSLCLSVTTCAAALVAVVFSVRSDLRKTGIGIRCDFAIRGSIASNEQWICPLELQNTKDRSVTVYEIFMEVGHGIFVQMEDLKQQPLVLEPYGFFYREYDPVEMYSLSDSRVTKVLDLKRQRRRVVLVTSQGRYLPRKGLRKWHPIIHGLSKNRATGVVWPVRRNYKGRCYGSEANLIISFTIDDDTEKVTPIYPGDHRFKKFGNARLTQEATESKEALERLLQDQIDMGTLSWKSFDIFDWQPERQHLMAQYPHTLELPTQGWFRYNVIGRVQTIRDKRKLKRKNKEIRAEEAAAHVEAIDSTANSPARLGTEPQNAG